MILKSPQEHPFPTSSKQRFDSVPLTWGCRFTLAARSKVGYRALLCKYLWASVCDARPMVPMGLGYWTHFWRAPPQAQLDAPSHWHSTKGNVLYIHTSNEFKNVLQVNWFRVLTCFLSFFLPSFLSCILLLFVQYLLFALCTVGTYYLLLTFLEWGNLLSQRAHNLTKSEKV